MVSRRTREKWSTKAVMWITGLIAMLLIAASFLLKDDYQNAKNILISVGCSIIASNLIMYFTSEFMIRTRRRIEIIDNWGLEAIYETRSEMNLSSNESLSKCSRNLDIIAFGLKNFRDAKADLIRELLDKKVEIRILTLDPESELLRLVDERENLTPNQTKKEITDLIKWCDDVNKENKKGLLTIKTYDFLPLDFYFRVDNKLFIGPYLKDKSSQQAISYEYSSGAGFLYWTRYFENIWKNLP